jgi:hypothetical protein
MSCVHCRPHFKTVAKSPQTGYKSRIYSKYKKQQEPHHWKILFESQGDLKGFFRLEVLAYFLRFEKNSVHKFVVSLKQTIIPSVEIFE